MNETTSGNGFTDPEGRTHRERLACAECGATASRRGVKFQSTGDVLRHQAKAHPHLRAGAKSPLRPPEDGARNGQRPARKPAHEAKFCPHCGLNLEVINAALGLIHGA